MKGLNYKAAFPIYNGPWSRVNYYDAGVFKSRPYEMWDGTGGAPKVWHVGPRSNYPLGLTLQQATKLFWRFSGFDFRFEGSFTATAGGISAPNAGTWDYNAANTPAYTWNQQSLSIASSTVTPTTLPTVFAVGGEYAFRDWMDFSSDIAGRTPRADGITLQRAEDDVLKSIFVYGRWPIWCKNVATSGFDSFINPFDALGGLWTNLRESKLDGGISNEAYLKISPPNLGNTYFLGSRIPFCEGKYWFGVDYITFDLLASGGGSWNEQGATNGTYEARSPSAGKRIHIGIGSYSYSATASDATNTRENIGVTVRLKLSATDIVEGSVNGFRTTTITSVAGGASAPSVSASISNLVYTIEPKKYFTYGGIYNATTGARI